MKSFFLLLILATNLSAQDQWLDFRGPHHTGVIDNKLPKVWSEGNNVTWKTQIHDHGISTPVIVDDRIVFTAATEDGARNYFLTVDYKSGKIIHGNYSGGLEGKI